MNKHWIVIGVIVASLAGAIYLNGSTRLGGSGVATYSSSENLTGSSILLARMSSTTVFADAVTTDGWKAAVDQLVETNKLDNVILNIEARGGTNTSTLYIRQMGSQDGTNYFNITTSTINRLTPTTTLSNLSNNISFIPGTATTTASIGFETYGYKYTRFIIWGDEVTLDPNDGIFAWIQAIKPEPLTR